MLYRLNDELLHYILKIVVRESCILITKCQTVSKDDFQKLLSTVPVSEDFTEAVTELTPETHMWASPLTRRAFLSRDNRQSEALLPEPALHCQMPDCLTMEAWVFCCESFLC